MCVLLISTASTSIYRLKIQHMISNLKLTFTFPSSNCCLWKTCDRPRKCPWWGYQNLREKKTRALGSFWTPHKHAILCLGRGDVGGSKRQVEKEWHLCPGVKSCLSKFSIIKVEPSSSASIGIPKLPSGGNSTCKILLTGSPLIQTSLQLHKSNMSNSLSLTCKYKWNYQQTEEEKKTDLRGNRDNLEKSCLN